MATITLDMLSSWADGAKLTISTIDEELELQIVAQVFSELSGRYNTELWTDADSTPALVQSILSMIYVGRIYQKTYAIDVENIDSYGSMLVADAEKLVQGIVNGSLTLTDARDTVIIEGSYVSELALMSVVPVELSLSEPKFSMDTVW